MPQVIDSSIAQRIGGFELNALLFADVLPPDTFQKARIPSSTTPVYDINGEILFYRLSVIKNRLSVGYADIAANSAFSEPLIGVSYGQPWTKELQLKEGITMAKNKRKGLKYDEVRFVAYSYPKLAIQFLLNGKETLMLELASWKPVPKKSDRKYDELPSNFERWSLVELTPKEKHQKNLRSFRKRMSNWDKIYPLLPGHKKPSRIKRLKFLPEVLDITIFDKLIRYRPIVRARELHYSRNNADHHPCYELRGQQTNVWCVAASVQMVLDFYRYNYLQTR